MTRALIIGCWLHFRTGEPAHQIVARVNSILLTGCGLHFNEQTGKEMNRGRKCGNCKRRQI